MSDYSKSVIYKFHKDDMTEIYIGSSKDEKKREQDHKSVCNNENCEKHNFKVYEFIRANGGYDNWKFEVIEHYPCENDIQLRIRERNYYDLLKPTLNTNRPYISEEEKKEYSAKYYEDNKEEFKEYNAKHYQDNIEENKKKMKNIVMIINQK